MTTQVTSTLSQTVRATTQTAPHAEQASPSQLERSTIRKVSLRLVPFVALMFFINFLDRRSRAGRALVPRMVEVGTARWAGDRAEGRTDWWRIVLRIGQGGPFFARTHGYMVLSLHQKLVAEM